MAEPEPFIPTCPICGRKLEHLAKTYAIKADHLIQDLVYRIRPPILPGTKYDGTNTYESVSDPLLAGEVRDGIEQLNSIAQMGAKLAGIVYYVLGSDRPDDKEPLPVMSQRTLNYATILLAECAKLDNKQAEGENANG